MKRKIMYQILTGLGLLFICWGVTLRYGGDAGLIACGVSVLIVVALAAAEKQRRQIDEDFEETKRRLRP